MIDKSERRAAIIASTNCRFNREGFLFEVKNHRLDSDLAGTARSPGNIFAAPVS
jgi:hypothetical protein